MIKKNLIEAEHSTLLIPDLFGIEYCQYLLKIFDSPWGDPFIKDMFKVTQLDCNNGKFSFS